MMNPFFVTALPPEAFDAQHMIKTLGVPPAHADSLVQMNMSTIVYENGIYQVNVRKHEAAKFWPPMLHLSIKRFDKQPIRDWRVMQEIKNLILSPEHEAVELYPAESRLTDTANQYHLWAFADAGIQFPFGMFDGRQVNDYDLKTKRLGAVQRNRE